MQTSSQKTRQIETQWGRKNKTNVSSEGNFGEAEQGQITENRQRTVLVGGPSMITLSDGWAIHIFHGVNVFFANL